MPDTAHALDARSRSESMLDHARAVFVEKGFDGASMHDLARAAGMSVGSYYRYFDSKAALVEAFVERDLALVEQAFATIVASPDPLSTLKALLRERLVASCPADDALFQEILAAAARKPEIAEVLDRMMARIESKLIMVMARVAGCPDAEMTARAGAHVRLITRMVGCVTRPDDDPAYLDLVVRQVDRLVDDCLNPRSPA